NAGGICCKCAGNREREFSGRVTLGRKREIDDKILDHAGFLSMSFQASMPFEILDRALVLERSLARRKRAEISAPAGLGILLARIEAVLARGKLANHDGSSLQIVARHRLAAAVISRIYAWRGDDG